MRRKVGTLIDIEIAILSAALLLLNRGEHEFHGYQLAREIKMANGDRYRSAAGTLYRALDRMEAGRPASQHVGRSGCVRSGGPASSPLVSGHA